MKTHERINPRPRKTEAVSIRWLSRPARHLVWLALVAGCRNIQVVVGGRGTAIEAWTVRATIPGFEGYGTQIRWQPTPELALAYLIGFIGRGGNA